MDPALPKGLLVPKMDEVLYVVNGSKNPLELSKKSRYENNA